jgi:type II secretory pathway pseudopilin PulG
MIRQAHGRARNAESGYALITILFLLGVVAVMLARSLPRDAMNAQRTREEVLIYRGEQYARAVKLYFRAHQRYPETLDDLEETDGVRFLRRRYRDPITGDDQWRLIKMGADGRFEDSLVYDTEKDDPAGGRTTPAAQAFAAAQLNNVTVTPNAAVAQRESAAPSNPFQGLGGTAGGAFAFPGQAVAEGPEGEPQVRPDGQPARGADGDYSQVLPGQVPTEAGQRDPRLGPNGIPAALAGIAPQQAPAYAGQPLRPDAVSAQATSLIGDLLTRPRPGGLAGLQGQTAPQQGAAASFQEGIAGVASKSERTGVKVYKDRETFNEWEFVYDYRKDAQMTAMGAQPAPAAAGGNINQGQPGLTPSGILGGNPGARQGNPFGAPVANPAVPQPVAPTFRRNEPPPAPEQGGRRTRRTARPRTPADFRPATPVPPAPPDPVAFPGQVPPETQQQN